jgi:hypothetical protein
MDAAKDYRRKLVLPYIQKYGLPASCKGIEYTRTSILRSSRSDY